MGQEWGWLMTGKSTVVALAVAMTAAVQAGEIHVAARDGDVATVTRLLLENPRLATVRCDMGKTPLHWATGWGRLEVMGVLLDRFHVDVNVRNKDDGTPLHVAASQAQPEAARILLRHGAALDARRRGGATPLHIAALKGGRPGHHEVACILLEAGAAVDARMDNGATPLQVALARGNHRTAAAIEAAARRRSGGGSGPTGRRGGPGAARGPSLSGRLGAPPGGGSFPERRRMLLQRFDANGDGVLDPGERAAVREMLRQRFEAMRRTGGASPSP